MDRIKIEKNGMIDGINPLAIEADAFDKNVIGIEKILRENEENISILFNALGDFLFVIDKSGIILSVNDTVNKRLAYRENELLGEHITSVYPENIREDVWKSVERIIKGEASVCLIPLETKKGEYIPVETRIVKGRWRGKDVLFRVSRDITIRVRAEEAKRISEDKFYKAFQSNPGSVVITRLDNGKIVDVNETFVNETGYKREEVIGHDAKELQLFYDVDDHVNLRFKIEKREKIRDFEIAFRTKNGNIAFGSLSSEIIDLEAGPHVLSVVNNLTQLKKISEQLRESEERFSTIIQNIPIGVCITNEDGIFEYLNLAYCNIFKYKQDELVGKHFITMFKEFERGIFDKPEYKVESIDKTKDGRLLSLLSDSINIIGSDGKTKKVTFVIDITERKKAEDQLIQYNWDLEFAKMGLEEKTQKLEREDRILKGVAEAVTLLLESLDFRRVMLQIVGILGNATGIDRLFVFEKKDADVEGSHWPVEMTYIWYSDDSVEENVEKDAEYGNIPHRWKESLLKKIPVYGIIEGFSSEEKAFLVKRSVVSALFIPVFVKDSFWGFMVFEDIKKRSIWDSSEVAVLSIASGAIGSSVERKEAYLKLEIAVKEAEDANRAKSRFLANMSHEIRTPMNAILGFSEILLNMTTDSERKSYLTTIVSSGKTLLTLINDILDLSKIEAGRLELIFEEVDIERLLYEIKHIFSQKIIEKGLEFILEIESGSPKILLLDEVRIRQVLFNLVGNAVKFTEKGFVKLSYSVKLSIDKEEYVDVSFQVEDTGIGIPENERDLIFESFRQQSGQDTRKYGGTGLGLTITDRLVEMMGGQIELWSKVSTGSRFSVLLPGIKMVRQIGINDSACEEDIEPMIQFLPAVVMIIDDVEYNRELIKAYLKDTALTVIESSSGEGALNVVDITKPDLLLVDLRMPNMDGYEFLEILKRKEGYSDIPAIAFTASLMKKEEDRIKRLFQGFLRKPVRKVDVINEFIRFLPYARINDKNENMEMKKPDANEKMKFSKKSDFQKLLALLANEYLAKTNEMLNGLIVDEVEIYCRDLRSLAKEYGISKLDEYAERVLDYTRHFEFDHVEMALRKFPALIERIRAGSEYIERGKYE